MTQSMLSAFAKQTISFEEQNKRSGFRRWNNLIYEWEVEYQGYNRPDEIYPDAPKGFIDFHVVVEIIEALVTARDKKYKKVKRPGYKLSITQNTCLPENDWESILVYEEEFKQDQLKKAFDIFQRELLNIQSWIIIAESRATLMPDNKNTFECPFCGWATDSIEDDISCHGCGKRFWSEKMWGIQNKSTEAIP